MLNNHFIVLVIVVIAVVINTRQCQCDNGTLLTANISQYQSDNAKRFLYEYGFLQVDDENLIQTVNESTLSSALILFQEYYKLPTDGKLSNETLELMQKPRCANSDIIADFQIYKFKWKKSEILWHYYLANEHVIELTKKAFDQREKHSSLRFKHDRTRPDILISNKNLRHKMQMNPNQCGNIFEGKGGKLAHGFFPSEDGSLREIHIDNDENWSYTINSSIPSGQVSLFSTLVHEIGHTLGLSHSDVSDAVMYAFYNGKSELNDDDILGIQNLYGKPQNTSETHSPPPPSPTVIAQLSDGNPIVTNDIDLCSLKNINMFLISNKRMYILYDKWLWILNINEKSYSNPIILTDWLTFLPKNATIFGVYQRPSGEIVMLVNSLVYMFDLTNFRLKVDYPKSIQTVFGISPKEVHTIFNSYSGKTYIFHSNNYYAEIDESTFTIKSWGYISELFPGIPPKIDSSFRYIDGNLYFFKNNMVYVFNEFIGELIKTEQNNLSIFGLECINNDVLLKLKDLISKLIIQRKKYKV